MKHFRITEVATGIVMEYDAELPQAEHLSARYRLEQIIEATINPDAIEPEYSGSWLITRYAFRRRLTADEKENIEVASVDVATASAANRKKTAALRVYMADMQAAEYIDLKDAELRSGVTKMQTIGLIAAGRAATILDTVPTAEERFNG